jgi:hypothetical protein
LNRSYLDQNELYVEKLGRGFAWLDTGTPESLLQASSFVQTIQARQGLKVACLEEIALSLGYLTPSEVTEAGSRMKSDYGKYLVEIAVEAGSQPKANHGMEKQKDSGDWDDGSVGQRDLSHAGTNRHAAA